MSEKTVPRVVAIAGGKGGTGKSLLAANVGIYLATLGKRVVLVDAALGAANLHVFLGTLHPQRSFSEAFAAGVLLEELAEQTPVPGLQLIAGERDPVWLAGDDKYDSSDIFNQLGELDADVVVVDAGSGTSGFVLDLFLAADLGLLVTTPDPAAVELCYRFVRTAFLRQLENVGLLEDAVVPADEQQQFEGGMMSPLDIYQLAAERDSELAERIHRQISGLRHHLVISCVRSKADMGLGTSMAAAGQRRMGVPITYLGYAEYDEAAWVSLRRRRPLLVEYPESRVSKCVEKIARSILARDSDRRAVDISAGESYYELFEVAPTASFEDIRRANRRIREMYSPESIVMSGLYTKERLDKVRSTLDGAYQTLMDANRRKEYDQYLFPDGVPVQPGIEPGAAPSTPPSETERPPMPDLGASTEYTGELLQQIRQAQGVALREIAERSKIGMTYLCAIEGERFAKLPAAVYVRGFLAEYSKIIGLNGQQVVDSYLRRYRAARSSLSEDS